MGEVVEKRVAADGTKRGLKRKGSKNKATILLEQMQAFAEEKYGIRNWDPVLQMSVVAMEAARHTPAVDDDGNPILDSETGLPVMVPPDKALELAALAKVAPYVHSQLKSVELTGEGGGPVQVDVADKARSIAERLGRELPEKVLEALEEHEDE